MIGAMDQKAMQEGQLKLTILPLHALTHAALIAASGTPTAPVLVMIWLVVVVA